jgi:hypothetical protein
MPAQDAILTKDNILRRKWQGDPGCYFCGGPEDRDHLFFLVRLQKWCGEYLPYAFISPPGRVPMFSTGPGFNQHYQGELVYVLGLAAICWAI